MIIAKNLMSAFCTTISLPLTQIIFHQASLMRISKISGKIHSQSYISILGVFIKTLNLLSNSLKFQFTIICFSETWSNYKNLSKNSLFQLEGCTLLHEIRKYRRGGGVAIFVHESLCYAKRNLCINCFFIIMIH